MRWLCCHSLEQGIAEHAISRGTVPPEVQDVDPGCAGLVKRWSRRGLERRPPEMHYFSLRTASTRMPMLRYPRGVTLGAILLLSPTLALEQQPAARAGPTPARTLLVLSKADQTLAIVDPTTLAVVARVPAGPDPHEVIAAADGRIAYVSNHGFGAYHTLTPVDLVRQEALPFIDLGALAGPHGLAVAGGKIWFTAEGAKVIGRYDPEARAVDWVLGTGQERTHMLVVFGDGKRSDEQRQLRDGHGHRGANRYAAGLRRAAGRVAGNGDPGRSRPRGNRRLAGRSRRVGRERAGRHDLAHRPREIGRAH